MKPHCHSSLLGIVITRLRVLDRPIGIHMDRGKTGLAPKDLPRDAKPLIS